MKPKQEIEVEPKPTLKTILAAELFSKLPEEQQELIIYLITALLSHG